MTGTVSCAAPARSAPVTRGSCEIWASRSTSGPCVPGVVRHRRGHGGVVVDDDDAAGSSWPGPTSSSSPPTPAGTSPTRCQALDVGAARVLLEKPVAPTTAEADALARNPRAGDVWVAAPLRAHRAFRRLLALLPQVGSPVSAHVWCQSWLPDWRPDRDYRESYSARADEGGVLRDLVHELDYAAVLLGAPQLLGAHLDHTGPLEMAAEQAATLLWSTGAATVTARLDYVTRPASRGIVVRGPEGALEWTVATGTVQLTDAGGAATEEIFEADLDRDVIMATQARAALDLRPCSTGDDAPRRRTGYARRGLATLALCDVAREVGHCIPAAPPLRRSPRDAPPSPHPRGHPRARRLEGLARQEHPDAGRAARSSRTP